MANVTLSSGLASKITARTITPSWPAQHNKSAWTGADKIVVLAGTEAHRFNVNFRPLATETEIREARAFFYALQGIVNTFELPYLPRPQLGTTTTVAGGGAAGTRSVSVGSVTNIVIGAPISVTLPSGHKRLFVVTNIVGTTLTVEPAFSESAAVGATVQVGNPVCRVRLADPSFSYSDEMGLASFNFEAVEAITG